MEQETINVVIILISGLVTWCINEWRKRSYEEYTRREEKYSELIRCLRGFYDINSSDGKLWNKKLITEFLIQLDLCWMYCPDDVIRKANDFLQTVDTSNPRPDEEKRKKAYGDLVLAIRKDLSRNPFRKTNLKSEEVKLLRAT